MNHKLARQQALHPRCCIDPPPKNSPELTRQLCEGLQRVSGPAAEAVAARRSPSQVERDLAAVDALGLTLKYCLNTHCHADHITGSGEIKKQRPGVQSMIAAASGAKADVQLKHGDTVEMGAVQVTATLPLSSQRPHASVAPRADTPTAPPWTACSCRRRSWVREARRWRT
jgi:hypothetical protein